MRSARSKQTFRLRLLALILALALLWYCVNPAPHTVIRSLKREDDQPDEKRGAARLPEISRASLSLQLYRPQRLEMPNALPPAGEEPDDFEWPEFIDG